MQPQPATIKEIEREKEWPPLLKLPHVNPFVPPRVIQTLGVAANHDVSQGHRRSAPFQQCRIGQHPGDVTAIDLQHAIDPLHASTAAERHRRQPQPLPTGRQHPHIERRLSQICQHPSQVASLVKLLNFRYNRRMKSESKPPYDTIAIVGVGLIGASLGLALRERKLARHVVGIGRTKKTLATAQARGAIDEATTSLSRGVKQASVIIVCTPVEKIAETVRSVAEHCPSTAIITDAGSTKAELLTAVGKQLPRGVRFVGGHPLAGSDKGGPEHAVADLFSGRAVVLTDDPPAQKEAIAELTTLWESLGARVVVMSAKQHDAEVAAISHAPHVIATALAAATPRESVPLAAGGWLDTTRIAAGDPELWRQILLSNPDHTLRALAKFGKVLAQLRRALKARDDAELFAILEAGKKTRDAVGS